MIWIWQQMQKSSGRKNVRLIQEGKVLSYLISWGLEDQGTQIPDHLRGKEQLGQEILTTSRMQVGPSRRVLALPGRGSMTDWGWRWHGGGAYRQLVIHTYRQSTLHLLYSQRDAVKRAVTLTLILTNQEGVNHWYDSDENREAMTCHNIFSVGHRKGNSARLGKDCSAFGEQKK